MSQVQNPGSPEPRNPGTQAPRNLVELTVLADLQYAFRSLVRRPGHTLLVVFTLALGIGINTVAFSSVNALIFRPFHIAGGDTFGWVFVGPAADPLSNVSTQTYDALRSGMTTVEAIAAEGRVPLSASSDAGPEQIWALAVSPNYFTVVPAPTRLGRVLSPTDVADDAVPVLISERYWQTRFGGTTDLQAIRPTINGQLARVMGVVRDDFQGPGGIFEPHVWLAFDALPLLRVNPGAGSDPTWLTLLARPRPGVSAAQVAGDVTAIARGLAPENDRAALRAQYIPIVDGHPEARQLGTAAALAMAAVGLVLLIACFNVAGLILARSVERQQELGLRAALGAGRARLTRLLLAEGLIVATLAGTAALLLAGWSEALLGGLSLPAPIPQRLHFSTDWRMVAFTAALVLVAAVVPTLTPTWRIARVDPIRWLKAGSTGAVGGLAPARARRAFVVLQVVGSTAFLTLALMFVASFVKSYRTDPGFNTTHTAVMQIAPSSFVTTPERQATLVQTLMSRLEGRPDVAGIAAAERISFHLGGGDVRRVSGDGRTCDGRDCPTVATSAVSSAFFDVMQIPLKAGRTFASTAGADRDAVIVNEAAATQLWPDAPAVGQWVSISGEPTPRQVIGVVATVISGQMQEAPRPYLYRPFDDALLAGPLTLVVRSRADSQSAAQAIRDIWRGLDDTLPPAAVQTMDERMALPLWPSRVSAAFFATCGIVAVILVTVGLFGVTYQVVSQRTREFGVRMALGATAADLRRMILGESLRLIGPGLVVGLLVAGGAASAAGALLVGVSPLDPRLYLAAVVLQVTVTLLASWSPALRASRVSPQVTMRAE